MERFGSDKPDMRFGLEIKNLTAAFAATSFKVFAEVIAQGGAVYAIDLPAANQLSRRELDEMTEAVRTRYSMGLAWIKVQDAAWQGPIAKFLTGAERASAATVADLKTGDTMLLMAGAPDKVRPILGDLRLQLGAKFALASKEDLNFLWVVDFPLFEYSEEDKRLVSVNHPFTAPHPDDLLMLDSAPTRRARSHTTWSSTGRSWAEVRSVSIAVNFSLRYLSCWDSRGKKRWIVSVF